MLCKIGAPIAISSFISAASAHKAATLVVATVSTVSWGVEYWAATRIWKQSRRLQTPKKDQSDDMEMEDLDTLAKLHKHPTVSSTDLPSLLIFKVLAYFQSSLHSHMDGLRYYFSTTVCIPSICVAILHASVLSYSATFTVYLLNAGFTLATVTVARAIGSAFEIASTVVFPYAVARLSSRTDPTQRISYDMNEPYKGEVQETLLEGSSDAENEAIVDEDGKPRTPYFEAGIVRVGLWGICGLFFCLVSTSFLTPYNPRSSPTNQASRSL